MPAYDARIADIQYWLNQTYGGAQGFQTAPDNGQTGWPTIQSLITALQIEVGVPANQITNSVGPLTLSLLTSRFGNIGPSTPSLVGGYNVVQLVKGALYCKGYSGGTYDGTCSATVAQSVQSMRSNMGFTDTRSTLAPKEFRALLTMDAYVLVLDGSASVREVQQWFNRTYYNESWFSVIPSDGYFSRNVQKGLVYALQKELSISGPTGSVGPATLAALKARAPIAVGQQDATGVAFVRLFQAAMRFNKYQANFTGAFTSSDRTQITQFQNFMKLPATGQGDYQSWCGLLTSSGDTDRPGNACDTSTPLTASKAATLYAAGYRVVGRYLTNATSAGAFNKKLQPGEISIITTASLKVYPIFQTYGGSGTYFNGSQGAADAEAAISAARGYGFAKGATKYFAIDFDATDDDMITSVIPHFRGIKSTVDAAGNYYQIGVYGSRNPCTRLADEGLTSSSMVLDMSNGYSGNLGFTMPSNWAWDQISTVTVGTGASGITIDKNVASGRDAGHSPVGNVGAFDVAFDPTQLAGLREMIWSQGELAKEIDGRVSPTSDVRNSVDRLMQYDTYLTAISRQFGIRKAFIQTVAVWEDWRVTPIDIAADIIVENSHAYRIAYQEALINGTTPPMAPPVVEYDCSTGFSQIFSRTAINGRNWAINNSLMTGTLYNKESLPDIWLIWQRLKNDLLFNLGSVPAVLMWGAAEANIPGGVRLDYTAGEVQAILARYNGTGADAETYGRATHLLYEGFEQFNALARA